MVSLPTVGNQIVTSSAPTSAITSGVIEKTANDRSAALGKVADDMMDVSTDLAKRQAADDLINQKVTRNADGSVNVENPASAPLIFGDAGKAFTDAVKVGTIAQQGNSLSQDIAGLHAKYPTDPAAFKAAAEAHLAKTAQTVTGPMGEAVQAEGQQLLTQHFNAITSTAASNDVENQKKSITSQIDDQKNTAIALARQGGANTPEFQQAVTKMNLSYDALGTNPLFKTPQDQIDIEKKNTAALLQGEAVVQHVDETFNKRGKAEAQKTLDEQLRQNPNLREVDRNRLYAQGMTHLAYLTSNQKEVIDAGRADVELLQTNLANLKVKAEDPVVGMAQRAAYARGDSIGGDRIAAAVTLQLHARGIQSLPDSVRGEAAGVPPSSAVNQSIPAEGRALLDRIAGTESAGRYNVRYGGAGDKTFQDYGDHPRVAEPITSGPDVGKTSSAAGRYQFIAPTWDAQKTKLGLKDFSPANQDAAAWDLAQTEYKTKTGGDLLTDLKSGKSIDSVLPSLSGQWSSLPGGRQPAGNRVMAPAANGGPGFTYEDLQRNPFLASAYFRSAAADQETRVSTAKQTAGSIVTNLRAGLLPPPESVGSVRQAAALYPKEMAAASEEMEGAFIGSELSKLPQEQHDQVVAAYKAAAEGQDIHHQNIANAALKWDTERQKNMADHPYQEAANRGWTQAPAPLDPSQPQSIAPALAQRATMGDRIGGLNHTPAPPILDKDEVPKLQSALQGPDGAAVLGQIAQGLRPDEMQRLIDGDGFKTSVTAMSRSGDPVKMNAAYSFMDAQQKQNPLQFDREFPDGLKDLRSWQSNLAFYPPDEAAKRLMRQYDPAQSAAVEASVKVADKSLENVSPANVVSKFSTGWGPIGTGARPPVGADAGIAGGALKADYDKNYRDGFAATGDPGMADKFAMEKLGNKYALSPTNGNRVMANAPENYYPKVAGSHDWMADQLDHEIAAVTGGKLFEGPRVSPKQGPRFASPMTDAGAFSRGQYMANRALVPDRVTETDIANKKPPSYQLVLQDPKTGRWGAMTDPASGQPRRIRFDPTQAFPQHAAEAERHRAAITFNPDAVVQP